VPYVGVVGGALALLAFIMRVLASVVGVRNWGPDDWTMCVAVVSDSSWRLKTLS